MPLDNTFCCHSFPSALGQVGVSESAPALACMPWCTVVAPAPHDARIHGTLHLATSLSHAAQQATKLSRSFHLEKKRETSVGKEGKGNGPSPPQSQPKVTKERGRRWRRSRLPRRAGCLGPDTRASTGQTRTSFVTHLCEFSTSSPCLVSPCKLLYCPISDGLQLPTTCQYSCKTRSFLTTPPVAFRLIISLIPIA